MNPPDEDFILFCKQATNAQLVEILRKEWKADKHRDYASARIAAEARQWTVRDGERIC